VTDTIGWGEVDVEPRRRRLPRWWVWVVAAVVVAAVALTPVVRDRLADRSAGWLARQWAAARSYDDHRHSLETIAMERAAPGDNALVAHVIQALDREQAARLRAMAKSVGGHRTWHGDVHATATAVRHALTAQAGDLDHDAQIVLPRLAESLFLPAPESVETQRLVRAATDAVARLTNGHHVGRVAPPTTTLTSAKPWLDQLARVTSAPVDAHLAVVHAATLDAWDLRTGAATRGVADVAPDEGLGGVIARVGDALLVPTGSGFSLVHADGRPPVSLPPADGYVAAADTGVWQLRHGSWRLFGADGRPVGPAHPTPAGFQVGAITATSDTIVLGRNSPFAGTSSVVWHPDSGRIVPVTDACDAGVAAARHVIVYADCNAEVLLGMNVDSGLVTRLPALGAGVHLVSGTVVPSADGSRAAFLTEATDSAVGEGRLAIADLRTRQVRTFEQWANPRCWSANGRVLLADVDDGRLTTSRAALVYWTDGMPRPAAIRVNVVGAPYAVALLP
jgi:hypothetical protein